MKDATDAIGIILKTVLVIGGIDMVLTILVWRVRMLNRNFDRREKAKVLPSKEKEAEWHLSDADWEKMHGAGW